MRTYYRCLALIPAALMAMSISASAIAAGWVTDTVSQIGIYNGSGCIYLTSGQVVLVDLSTDADKAEWSTALSAQAQQQSIRVYQTDDPLVGGCNTGTTIKPHTALLLVN